MNHPMAVGTQNRQVSQFDRAGFRGLPERRPMVNLAEIVAENQIDPSKLEVAGFTRKLARSAKDLLFFVFRQCGVPLAA
jgi:hypothetical protein